MAEDLKTKLDNLGNDKLSPLNSKKLETYNSLNAEPNKKVEVQKPNIQATTIKKGAMQKFAEETNIRENAKNAGTYILKDVIMPALKKTIDDIVCGGIKTMLYGENANRPNNNSKNGYVSYSSISTNNGYIGYKSPNQDRRVLNDNVLFYSESDARDALEYMCDILREDGYCTVAQLYDFAHKSPEYTDSYYGWKDLRGVRVVPFQDKWFIDLPKPVLIRK